MRQTVPLEEEFEQLMYLKRMKRQDLETYALNLYKQTRKEVTNGSK